MKDSFVCFSHQESLLQKTANTSHTINGIKVCLHVQFQSAFFPCEFGHLVTENAVDCNFCTMINFQAHIEKSNYEKHVLLESSQIYY